MSICFKWSLDCTDWCKFELVQAATPMTQLAIKPTKQNPPIITGQRRRIDWFEFNELHRMVSSAGQRRQTVVGECDDLHPPDKRARKYECNRTAARSVGRATLLTSWRRWARASTSSRRSVQLQPSLVVAFEVGILTQCQKPVEMSAPKSPVWLCDQCRKQVIVGRVRSMRVGRRQPKSDCRV